jgi:hypothetical protein
LLHSFLKVVIGGIEVRSLLEQSAVFAADQAVIS